MVFCKLAFGLAIHQGGRGVMKAWNVTEARQHPSGPKDMPKHSESEDEKIWKDM